MKGLPTNFRFRYLLIVGIIFISFSAKSQVGFSAHHNLLAGYDYYHGYSLQYENAILVKKNFFILGYVGVLSDLFIDRSTNINTFGIPFGINLVLGKNKHHFESDIGFLRTKFYDKSDPSFSAYSVNNYQLKLGYRFQELKSKGLIFRIGLSTSIEGENPRSDVFYSGIERLSLGAYIGLGYGF